MKIQATFGNDYFINGLNEQLKNEEGAVKLILAEYSEDGEHRLEFIGLKLALSQNPEELPIILTSFMSESDFLKMKDHSTKFQALMAKRKIGFLQLPFTDQDFLAKYQELMSDEKVEDILAVELEKIDDFQTQMGYIKHSISGYVNNPESDQAKERIAKALIDGRNIGLLGTDSEVIEQIIGYVYQPVPNKYFAGRFFAGVFCDIEGTLLVDNKVNGELLITLKELSKGRQITLWTGGNLREIKETLLKNKITWKLVPKSSFSGAEVEMAIDDEPYTVFHEKYGIEVKDFIQI